MSYNGIGISEVSAVRQKFGRTKSARYAVLGERAINLFS